MLLETKLLFGPDAWKLFLGGMLICAVVAIPIILYAMRVIKEMKAFEKQKALQQQQSNDHTSMHVTTNGELEETLSNPL